MGIFCCYFSTSFAQLIRTWDWDQNSGFRLVFGLSEKTERKTNPRSEITQWFVMMMQLQTEYSCSCIVISDKSSENSRNHSQQKHPSVQTSGNENAITCMLHQLQWCIQNYASATSISLVITLMSPWTENYENGYRLQTTEWPKSLHILNKSHSGSLPCINLHTFHTTTNILFVYDEMVNWSYTHIWWANNERSRNKK